MIILNTVMLEFDSAGDLFSGETHSTNPKPRNCSMARKLIFSENHYLKLDFNKIEINGPARNRWKFLNAKFQLWQNDRNLQVPGRYHTRMKQHTVKQTWYLVSPHIPVFPLYIWCNTPKYFMSTQITAYYCFLDILKKIIL